MMNYNKFRSDIDRELINIKVSSTLKKRIAEDVGKGYKKRKNRRVTWRLAVVFVLLFVLGATTAFAGYLINSRINVNETTLPELDAMKIVQIDPVSAAADQYGFIEADYSSYTALAEELAVPLLNFGLTAENPYMAAHINTDNKDYAMITVDNYIIGDTSDFVFDPEINTYRYRKGEIYYSPVSLSVDMILSQEQMDIGLEMDYLGMYKYLESYVSEQGYRVNIIGSTVAADAVNLDENFQSEKIAVFVADGIRYTLKGHVSAETLKALVNSMAY
ncbi:MAG: hypothetical protein ACOX7J_02165 [Bacillota bacterium]|jgi:hypothetical protein